MRRPQECARIIPRMRPGSRLRARLVLIAIATLASIAGAASSAPSAEDTAPAWTPPLAAPAGSVGRAVFDGDVAQVEARLLVHRSETDGWRVGVLFDLAPGWHLYWRNPGETGIAPDLGLGGEGLRFSDVEWPVPTVFEEADGLFTTFGYAGSVLLTAGVTETAPRGEGAAPSYLRADVTALVCRTECVPARFALEAPLEAAASVADRASIAARFAVSRERLPVPDTAAVIHAKARWLASLPATDASAPVALDLDFCPQAPEACPERSADEAHWPFLPFEADALEFAGIAWADAGDAAGRRIDLEATRLEAGAARLRGLVPFVDASGRLRHAAIDVPIEAATTAIAASTAAATPPAGATPGTATTTPRTPVPENAPPSPTLGRWLQVLLLALVGGLILNGMPCVLPVLAIKVVAIADLADKDRAEVRTQGLAYTVGVLGSMAILAGVVLSLRAAGHSVGWGFQFQEPAFVAGISAVLVTFALNLFGVFEIDFGQGRLASVGQAGSATRRSLFEGLLAVVLATPCTAPFLGTAVGFAFAAPGAGILAIFLAIGLGLALPFLIVSFVPAFARFIPRSGPWMLKLRAGLGFFLLGTVVWLLWIVGQSGGTAAIVGLVGLLLVLAFLLWGFGQAQPLERPWAARGSALAIAAVAIAGVNGIEFEPSVAPRTAAPGAQEATRVWTPYSEVAVAAALAEGRPAFVVFTADWCITCKVNEKRVIDRPETHALFARDDVALFEADWTRRDDRIRTTLARFGRAGVPLYLVYSPDAPNTPQVLSELITAQEVQAALAHAVRPARG